MVVVEVTFSEFVGGWLRDPVVRQVVARAAEKELPTEAARGYSTRPRA